MKYRAEFTIGGIRGVEVFSIDPNHGYSDNEQAAVVVFTGLCKDAGLRFRNCGCCVDVDQFDRFRLTEVLL